MSEFDNSQTAEVDVLNGWFLMVRREALDKSACWMSSSLCMEKTLTGLQIYKAGWKRVYFSGARAFHYGGASSAVAPTRFYVEMKRANLQLWKKHHGRLLTLGYVAVAYLHEILRVMSYAVLSLLKGSKRSVAVLKIKRSLACIRWLVSQDRKAGVTVS
jgi:GT2 family glycosyltransferase